jgi:hypothetical protein
MGTFADTANIDQRLSLPTKENKIPFAFCRKQTEVSVSAFHMQQTHGSCPFPLAVYVCIYCSGQKKPEYS